MRYRVILLVLITFGVSIVGCGRSKKVGQPVTGNREAEAANGLAQQVPLVLDNEPLLLADEPLLLEDEPADTGLPGMADNSRCHVCHINYQQEEIAVTHAKVGTGCKDCHGASDEHIADESWASGGNGTAPDRMFPRDTINSFCMTCHPQDSINLPQHAPVFANGDDRKVCTDCHGKHRLHTRKCKWK